MIRYAVVESRNDDPLKYWAFYRRKRTAEAAVADYRRLSRGYGIELFGTFTVVRLRQGEAS